MAEKRKRLEDILSELQAARRAWPIGTAMAHKNGGTYRVVGHCFHTETQEICVAYRRIAGPNYDRLMEATVTYTRPISLFTEDRFREIG